MPVTVRIPTPLQSLTGGQNTLEASGKNIGELIDHIDQLHPGLKARICDEHNQVRRFINIYVNEEDIRFKQGRETALKEGDEVSIIPAIAGGAPTHYHDFIRSHEETVLWQV